MPANVIQSDANTYPGLEINKSEKAWKEAKVLARKAGKSENYPYIMSIYQNLTSKYKTESSVEKNELRMFILENAEILSESLPSAMRKALKKGKSPLDYEATAQKAWDKLMKRKISGKNDKHKALLRTLKKRDINKFSDNMYLSHKAQAHEHGKDAARRIAKGSDASYNIEFGKLSSIDAKTNGARPRDFNKELKKLKRSHL